MSVYTLDFAELGYDKAILLIKNEPFQADRFPEEGLNDREDQIRILTDMMEHWARSLLMLLI